MARPKRFLINKCSRDHIYGMMMLHTPFLQLQHPFTCIVAAPTKAGKTTFVSRLIDHAAALIKPPPDKVIWCYSEWQESYNKLHDVRFVHGLPDVNSLRQSRSKPTLIVLDDLMSEVRKDGSIVELFTRGCHHWSCSVIHITQDIFFDNRRTNRINSQYIVLMKNPADKLTPLNIAKQMYPGRVAGFMDAFNHATKEPHGYLFIDLDQKTPEEFRLRTNIFPDEATGVYTLKSNKSGDCAIAE